VTVNADSSSQSTLQLPRLEVRRVLGSGGMGVVHAAYDPLLEREVAVKVIRVTGAASGARARILREARAIARISHPNVVHVYSAEAIDDQVAIVMELVQGQTLRAWLAEKKRTWQEIVAVFVEAGRGLAAAHDAGLVHRDFKPDNVMVRSDGRVCVLDFGLARALEAQAADGSTVPLTPDTARTLSAETTVTLDASTPVDHASPPGAQSRVTATGALVGTPLYMAPEQHLGASTDARADQFAFCVALYRALFGGHPFDDTEYESLAKSVVGGEYRVPPRSTVPPRVTAAIRRGLSARAEHRFPNMQALLLALARRRISRRWWLASVSLICVLVSGTIAWVYVPAPRSLMDSAFLLPGPTGITSADPIDWTTVSPDEKWLVFRAGAKYILRDLTRNQPDVALGPAWSERCGPSWSPTSRQLALRTGATETRIVDLDTDVPARIIPSARCAVFIASSELTFFDMAASDLTFWNVKTGAKRSCQLYIEDKWIFGIDASPRAQRLLLTTFNDRTNQLHVWSMTTACDDVSLLASRAHGSTGPLPLSADAVPARWGRGPHEIIVRTGADNVGEGGLVAISTTPPFEQTVRMVIPSVLHFSVTGTGTLYYATVRESAQLWLRPHAGGAKRLTNRSAPRYLGSLTADGNGFVYVEDTPTGTTINVTSFEDSLTVILPERRYPRIRPRAVSMSFSGTLAIIGDQDGTRGVWLLDSEENLANIPDAPAGSHRAYWVRDRLLLSTPGNRNFAIFDAAGRRTLDLLEEPVLGFVFDPVGSPDGNMVAFWASLEGRVELWRVDLATREATKIGDDVVPIGWSADGNWVFGIAASPQHHLVRVPKDGGAAQQWGELPDAGHLGQALATPRGDVIISYGDKVAEGYSVGLPPAGNRAE
jgi:serine/threonine protein kinase/WD40 repeat protein